MYIAGDAAKCLSASQKYEVRYGKENNSRPVHEKRHFFLAHLSYDSTSFIDCQSGNRVVPNIVVPNSKRGTLCIRVERPEVARQDLAVTVCNRMQGVTFIALMKNPYGCMVINHWSS